MGMEQEKQERRDYRDVARRNTQNVRVARNSHTVLACRLSFSTDREAIGKPQSTSRVVQAITTEITLTSMEEKPMIERNIVSPFLKRELLVLS